MLTKPRDPSKMLQEAVSTRRKHRFSPLMLAGVSVPVILALIVVGVIFVPRVTNKSHAANAAPNPNCTLIVPPDPLTAQGLATPYQLLAPDAAQNGPCNEANTAQSAFVQAAIFDPNTNTVSIYEPLVVDQGTQPAVAPTPPNVPAGATVGIWFGFNGTTLTLQDNNGSLAQGQCVNGAQNSPFGQFAYCNAVNFFNVVNGAIQAGNFTVPALATANDGLPCVTNRDFSAIDQDPSDNVQTQYLVNGNGQTAQFSTANQAQLANATTISNPSDNALISQFIDPALGCTPFTAPDQANNNTPTAALPLDELLAAADQQAPVANIPANDPMVLNNNNQDLNKVNLYRAGVDETPANSIAADANPTTFCQNEFTSTNANTGLIRLANDSQNFFINATSPMPAAANSLATFLAMRANQSFTNLGCGNLLNIQDPVALVMNNCVVVGATYTLGNGTTVQIGQQQANNNCGNNGNNGDNGANGNDANNAVVPNSQPSNGDFPKW
jgi:hypothetical protein